MSLPLTRRIAKTVLLTAAGAASVVGTAGAASAAELPTTAAVGGPANLDNGVGEAAVEGAQAVVPKSSSSPLGSASVPEADVAAETKNGQAAKDTAKFAGDVAHGAEDGAPKHLPDVRESMPNVQAKGLPTTDKMPQTTPATDAAVTPVQQQDKKVSLLEDLRGLKLP